MWCFIEFIYIFSQTNDNTISTVRFNRWMKNVHFFFNHKLDFFDFTQEKKKEYFRVSSLKINLRRMKELNVKWLKQMPFAFGCWILAIIRTTFQKKIIATDVMHISLVADSINKIIEQKKIHHRWTQYLPFNASEWRRLISTCDIVIDPMISN